MQWLKINCGVLSSVFDLENMLEIDLSSGKTCSIRRMDKPKIGTCLSLVHSQPGHVCLLGIV